MDHKGNELASSLNAENKDNAVEITCYTDFVGGCNSTFSNNSPSKSGQALTIETNDIPGLTKPLSCG
ncbi:hypothetical protein AKJ16_DCAP27646 [Drosera capensis]